MTPKDLKMYRETFPAWATKLKQVNKILLLSPFDEQVQVMRSVFPAANVVIYTVNNYNLNTPLNKQFDIIVAMNVFMYSPNPQRWFDNLLPFCRCLWLQDLIYRKRSKERELGADTDRMRYSYPPDHIATFESAFDLNCFGDDIVEFVEYNSGGNTVSESSRHFLLYLNGQL